jgi:dephospho-CoA kinase
VEEGGQIASKPIIGVTGAIGAGKTTVAGMLGEAGCVVADSDVMAQAALDDPEIRGRLVEWWGQEILDAAGAVDRGAVAQIVFARPPERLRLESVVHPWIEKRRESLFAAAPPETAAYVIDAPLLFEAGLDASCDAVIFVDARRELRLERVAATRGWGEPELAKREDSQLPLDDKRSRSDYVIRNDGDLNALREQVRRILDEILDPRPK